MRNPTMSRQATNRAVAINKEFESIVKKSNSVVSELERQTAEVKLFVTFLHDNLLGNKGDLSEGDRVDLRDAIVPLYPKIQAALSEVEAMFNIHDDDAATWTANFETYKAANPGTLTEALDRFPKVD